MLEGNIQADRQICRVGEASSCFQTYFRSLELGLRSLSMIPRVKLLASFNCLCSEGFILPTSGSHTMTSSFDEAIGDGNKKLASDSCITKENKVGLFWLANRNLHQKVQFPSKYALKCNCRNG